MRESLCRLNKGHIIKNNELIKNLTDHNIIIIYRNRIATENHILT